MKIENVLINQKISKSVGFVFKELKQFFFNTNFIVGLNYLKLSNFIYKVGRQS